MLAHHQHQHPGGIQEVRPGAIAQDHAELNGNERARSGRGVKPLEPLGHGLGLRAGEAGKHHLAVRTDTEAPCGITTRQWGCGDRDGGETGHPGMMTHARGSGCRYRDGMLAMVLTATSPIGTKPLRFATFPDPSPGPGEVLIRVRACAACRTDVQIAEGDLRARTMPIVLGHQVAGRIEGLGEGVTDWAEGDRAGLTWLAGSCGDCAHCQAGRENLCEQATFTGWDRHGGFAEMVAARADVVVPLPDGPEDRHLAPLLCGGVIGFRALRVAGVTPGSRVGLYGFGASALQAIQVARHWGCRVAVATRSDEGRSRALAMGAEWVGGYDDAPPFPLDAAVTFAPSGDVVVAALRALERGGRVAVNAIHLDRIPQFNYGDLWWERSIRSVANVTRADARDYLAIAAQIPVRTEVEEYALPDANRALQRIASGEVQGAAVIIP